jgi:hypothetical protein
LTTALFNEGVLLAESLFIVFHKTPTSGGGPVKGSTGLFKPSKPSSPANGLDSIGKANAETVFEATAFGGGNSLLRFAPARQAGYAEALGGLS